MSWIKAVELHSESKACIIVGRKISLDFEDLTSIKKVGLQNLLGEELRFLTRLNRCVECFKLVKFSLNPICIFILCMRVCSYFLWWSLPLVMKELAWSSDSENDAVGWSKLMEETSLTAITKTRIQCNRKTLRR